MCTRQLGKSVVGLKNIGTFFKRRNFVATSRLFCTPKNEMALDDDNAMKPNLANWDNIATSISPREEDLKQLRDLDDILIERSLRFHDPKFAKSSREPCILVAVEPERRQSNDNVFSLRESLQELSELVGTAGLEVLGTCIQKLNVPNQKTYVGSGKVSDIVGMLNATRTKTIVIDDDLTPKQQRNLETSLKSYGAPDVKVLDRTAVILDIFAQHAKSREGQLQTELAMLEYRMTRGPRPTASGGDKGAGFRGPGESKLELDKRYIKDKIILLQKEIASMGTQRELHRYNRKRLGLPLVALVGYTNAGKSTLLNLLSRAGVLAENMLFATLDPTTRRVKLPRSSRLSKANLGQSPDFISTFEKEAAMDDDEDEKIVEVENSSGKYGGKGSEILLTDTVGFISKLPTNLVAAFRATLEEVGNADVLIHVIDRSSPVWRKQRETVLCELDNIGCEDTVIVELWNKVDALGNAEDVMLEAATLPIDVEAFYDESNSLDSADNNNNVLPEDIMSNKDDETDDDDIDDIEVEVQGEEDEFAMLKEEDTIFGTDILKRKMVKKEKALRPKRKIFTVAASAKTGLGMADFLATLEDALSTLLVKMDVFVPYDQDDGIIAAIHSQGAVDAIDYKNTGTFITCRIGSTLVQKLEKFKVQEGVSYL
eukprot:gene12359-26000_t